MNPQPTAHVPAMPQMPVFQQPASHLLSADQLMEAASQYQEESNLRTAGRGPEGPRRFRLKAGEIADFLFLDSCFAAGAALREHRVQSGQNWGEEPCISAIANCPLCAKEANGQPPYPTLFQSIFDLRTYDVRDNLGNPTGEKKYYGLKLLPIKTSQLKRWKELVETPALNIFGTLRGAYVRVQRGMGQTAPAIGDPINIDAQNAFLHYNEEDIVRYFGHPAITDDAGNVLVPANGLLQPFTYTDIFPPPDVEGILARYGAPGVGNPAMFGATFQQGMSAPPMGAPSRHQRTAPTQPAYGSRSAPSYSAAPAGFGQPAPAQPATRPPAPAYSANPPGYSLPAAPPPVPSRQAPPPSVAPNPVAPAPYQAPAPAALPPAAPVYERHAAPPAPPVPAAPTPEPAFQRPPAPLPPALVPAPAVTPETPQQPFQQASQLPAQDEIPFGN